MSLITAFADRRFDDNGRLLSIALNNMAQGVVMFDTAGRLIVCNDRYRTMYDSRQIVKPGASLSISFRHRSKSGALHRDPEQYCAELMEAMAAGKVVSSDRAPRGRTISVVNRAIPGGSYWVGTHDDITERRSSERKGAC